MIQTSTFTHGYALLVGVGGDLPGTIQDAVALRDILTNSSRCAYPPGQVKLLTENQADQQGIFDGLDWLIRCVNQDEKATAIVYFSGHGGFAPNYHLVPTGYNNQDLENTAVSGTQFTQKLRAIHAQKLLIILDCCYAAGITTAKTPSGFRPSSIPPELSTILTQGSGRVFIASSRQDEESQAGSPYSVFTQALREGFAGYGTATRDGYVYIADVALYVGRVVPARTRGSQHPMLDMRKADNFALAYYAAGAKTPIPLRDTPVLLTPLNNIHGDIVEQYQKTYRQYQQNLAAIEARMAVFIDQAAVPLDYERAKEQIQKKLSDMEAYIQTIAQQQDSDS